MRLGCKTQLARLELLAATDWQPYSCRNPHILSPFDHAHNLVGIWRPSLAAAADILLAKEIFTTCLIRIL